MSYFAWAVYHIAMIACFTGLAIRFDKWWIILLSLLFCFNLKK